MRKKEALMEILQMPLEKRLEMLSEGQRIYVQGYLDGILQAYRPLKSNGNVHQKKGNHENEKK
jgi:hypothetical protein